MTAIEILKEFQKTFKKDFEHHHNKRNQDGITDHVKGYHNGQYAYAKQMYNTVNFKLTELED